MKLEIREEKTNRLLHRTELNGRITFDGATPRKDELLKELIAKKHVDDKLVVIDSLDQKFGKHEATFSAKIYESEKVKKMVEGEKKPKKEKTPKEEAPAAKPAAKPEEKKE